MIKNRKDIAFIYPQGAFVLADEEHKISLFTLRLLDAKTIDKKYFGLKWGELELFLVQTRDIDIYFVYNLGLRWARLVFPTNEERLVLYNVYKGDNYNE